MLKVVECRFFAGFTEAETAEALSVSEKTVEREWRRAKAWLRSYDRTVAAGAGSAQFRP